MPHAHPSGSPAIGLLVLRIGAAAPLLIAHGWSKLAHFEQRRTTFADPIGIGPLPGLVLTIFAEVFCSIAVMLGLFTRLAVIPPLVVLLVAFFVVHAGDPWRTRELPLVFDDSMRVKVVPLPDGGIGLESRVRPMPQATEERERLAERALKISLGRMEANAETLAMGEDREALRLQSVLGPDATRADFEARLESHLNALAFWRSALA